MADEIKKDDKIGSPFFIPAGLFIGFGLGFFLNNIPAGMFVGMGLGFLFFGIARMLGK